MAKKQKTKRSSVKRKNVTGKSKKALEEKVIEEITPQKLPVKEKKKPSEQAVTIAVEDAGSPEEKVPSVEEVNNAPKRNAPIKFKEVLYKPLEVIYERFHLKEEFASSKDRESDKVDVDFEESAENENLLEIEVPESLTDFRRGSAKVTLQETRRKMEETCAKLKLRERLKKKKSVAFGVIRQDEGTEVDGYTWLFDHVVGSAMSEKQQERNKHLMRPLLKHVHPRCIPVYSHRPTLSRKAKSKKRSKKERQDWLQRLSRPKRVFSEPLVKIRRHTKPRTAEERREWYHRNSRPKEVKRPPPIVAESDQPRRTYEEMLPRLIELSRPKRINKKTPPPDYVDRKSLKYEATDRIKALAQPRPLHPEFVKDLEYDFDKKMERALKYRTTERVRKLAQPKLRTEAYQRAVEDPDESAFRVKSGALKYKPSKRILELAKPRIYHEEKTWDPYAIKPTALRYNLTPRMLELSKPKGNPKEFQHNCFKDLY